MLFGEKKVYIRVFKVIILIFIVGSLYQDNIEDRIIFRRIYKYVFSLEQGEYNGWIQRLCLEFNF